MPRGFLVKRTKHPAAHSYRVRRQSDSEPSDSGSDMEYCHTNFGSPDSGFSQSPITLTFRENELLTCERDVTMTSSSSPLTITTSLSNNHPSPLYFSAFDRLAVSSCSNSPSGELFVHHSPHVATAITPSNFATTPASPNKKRMGTDYAEDKQKTPKKPKSARKINFDDKSSPVSGTIIREFTDSDDEGVHVVSGDIDSAFNFVEATPEARAELEKIENKIGDYICQLCKEHYGDAFQLAQHRCSRIIHVEYRCPECDKVFNCPANLASHRRWHKPRPHGSAKSTGPARILPATNNNNSLVAQKPFPAATNGSPPSSPGLIRPESVDSGLNTAYHTDSDSGSISGQMSPLSTDIRTLQTEDGYFECETCGKKFRRQAYLKKHRLSHSEDRVCACQVCGKVLKNESAREKHLLQHLTNESVNCSVCNASFTNEVALEKHMRVHSETFACKYCDNIFYSSPGLTRHINKCHPSENRQVILLQLNRPC